MAGSDAARADLFTLLEQSIGRETAAALMDHIPPEGWPDFATKSDLSLVRADMTTLRAEVTSWRSESEERLGLVEERLGRRIDAVDHRVELMEHRILGEVDRRLRAQTWITTTALLGGLGLAFSAGRIG